ncbi:MAG: CPBP family glutamic-type intramembrane protease [Bacteroidota bacterium]
MESLSPTPKTPTPTSVPTVPATYFPLTRTATYSFLASLPLFLLYEVLITLANRGQLSQVRISAEVWTKRLLASLGGTGLLGLGIAVLAIGIVVFMMERKKKIPIRPRYLGWMLGESLVYALVLGALVGTTVGAIFNMALSSAPLVSFPLQAGPESLDPMMQLALSLGAGLYEELVFRVVLVGGMAWAFAGLFKSKTTAYIVAAVIGAAIFSGVHYIGSLGDVFTLPSFTFRFLFGLALNALFLLRGFGIAAWTHALYDVSIVFGVWG